MAKFPIQRAPEKLGVVPTTAVRANLDVRTGGQELAGAIAGFGGAIANLGLRWDLMEASTQLNEAKMKAKQEHTRLMLALPGLEPDEHTKEYENSLKVQQGFMPTNRRAAGAYRQLLNNFAPQWELNVENATKAKLKDNFRAVGFGLQQDAIRDGNFIDYFKHLATGQKKVFAAYTAEEVAKYKQSTIDGRERFVKLQTAQQLEQLEIQREGDRDEISKLIRAGQSAEATIEGSNLDEKEQFTWFERQRLAIERRLKGEEIVTDRRVEGELEAMAYDISTGAVTMLEFKKRLNKEYRDGTINDNTYEELFSLAERKFDSYQSEAMKMRETYALTQLVTLPSEEAFAEMLARLTSKFDKEQAQTLRQLQFDNLDRYKKALRDWLKKNPDANADEVYIEGRKILVHYRKVPNQLREEVANRGKAGRAAVEAIMKIAVQAVPQPKTKAEYDKLESGTKYIDPEGVERIKE